MQICKVGQVRAGQKVVVFGCGPIGLLVQSVAKAYAAKTVIGIDLSQSRLDLASNVLKCADGVFLPPPVPKKQDGSAPTADEGSEYSAKIALMIKDQFNLGEGPEVVIDATGAQPCIQMN